MQLESVQLCDLNQGTLHELDGRQAGLKIGISRHAARSCSVNLHMSDPALEDAAIHSTILKVTAVGWSEPVFVGRIVSIDKNLTGEAATVTLNALDPWAHLEKCQVLVEDATWTPDVVRYLTFTARQQTEIMWELIESALANGHGVAEGSQPAGSTLTATYPAGAGVAESVLAVANLQGGPDFELTPTEATDGTLVTFNGFATRQGSDLTGSVVVGVGLGEDGDALAIQRKPTGDQVVNRFTAIGDAIGTASDGVSNYPSHAAYVAEHTDSQTDLGGIFEASESLSGTTDAAILEAHAKSIVAANAYPTEIFTLLLDPEDGAEFSPDGDFWMGDTIGTTVHEPWMDAGAVEELEGRIGSASLTELENGLVAIEVTCEPELFSGVTGASAVVVVDNSEGTLIPVPDPNAPVDNVISSSQTQNISQAGIGGGLSVSGTPAAGSSQKVQNF